MLAHVKNWLGCLAGSLFDAVMCQLGAPVVVCEGFK
jgi:hypothetical protein